MDTQRIFPSSGKPFESNAPASVAAPGRSGGGWGAIIDAVLRAAAVVLVSLLFLEILVRVMNPGFQAPGCPYSAMTLDERQLVRERNAKELERTWQRLVEMKAAQE